MGDERTYEYTVAIRAVESRTDDRRLGEAAARAVASISSRIVNEVKGINRVVYDISSNHRQRLSGMITLQNCRIRVCRKERAQGLSPSLSAILPSCHPECRSGSSCLFVHLHLHTEFSFDGAYASTSCSIRPSS
jgi:hypothetical protein